MSSQVFDCIDRELEGAGLPDEFNACLKQHPELNVCPGIRHGEEINGDSQRNRQEMQTLLELNNLILYGN